MIDAVKFLHEYLDPYEGLFDIVYTHSLAVAGKALEIAGKHPELSADKTFIEEASLLHDIGVFKTNAPAIKCYGMAPYICHGVLGAEILRKKGLPEHALVCERHTGTGLSLKEIVAKNLPLPHRDLLPQSIEEQIICFSDKFYSKSHLERVRDVKTARKKVEHYGIEGLARFDNWCRRFL